MGRNRKYENAYSSYTKSINDYTDTSKKYYNPAYKDSKKYINQAYNTSHIAYNISSAGNCKALFFITSV